MSWRELTVEGRIEVIKSVWEPSMSGRDIAAAVSSAVGESVTRNAVIGMYTRYPQELSSHPMAGAAKRAKKPRASTEALPKALSEPTSEKKIDLRPVTQLWMRQRKRSPEEALLRYPSTPTSKVDPEDERYLQNAKPLIDLNRGECHYALGSGPILYCGEPVSNGSQYCAHHRRVMYVAVRKS